jgi:hypothetical protein
MTRAPEAVLNARCDTVNLSSADVQMAVTALNATGPRAPWGTASIHESRTAHFKSFTKK